MEVYWDFFKTCRYLYSIAQKFHFSTFFCDLFIKERRYKLPKSLSALFL